MNVSKLLCIMLLLFTLPTSAQNWNQVIKSIASIRGSGANYGGSVSVNGNYAVIGALSEATDAGGSNSLTRAGAAYVLQNINGNWVEVKKLVAPDRRVDDFFGNSVSISGDNIIIGASNQDYNEANVNLLNNAGAAYIFNRNQGGTDNWGFVKKLVSLDRAVDDFFGHSVSIDGDNIVVGAYAEDENQAGTNTIMFTGSAYIFNKNEGGVNNWGQVRKIVASDRSALDQFGISVSISGNVVAVGAFQEDEDAAGTNTLSNAGSVYVFYKDQGGVNNWGQLKKVVSNDRGAGDFLGISVSLSGSSLAVGAFQEDHDAQGGAAFSNSGSAYVFEKDLGGVDNWGQAAKVVGTERAASDFFGRSVSISGNTLLIGALNEDEDVDGLNTEVNAGAAYIYSRNQGGVNSWGNIRKITASDRGTNDFFGLSVATDGNNLVVGALQNDEDLVPINTILDAGSAYFFKGSCNNFPIIMTSQFVIGNQSGSNTDYYNTQCGLILSITPNGASPILGHTKSTVWVDGIQNAGFVRRHFEVSPINGVTTPTGKVKLYFTQQEFDAFNAINTYKFPSGPTDNAGKANIRIRRYAGLSASGSGLPASYGTATTELIDPIDSDIIWNAASMFWEISFNTTGFGGFFAELPPPTITGTGTLTAYTSCAGVASNTQSVVVSAGYLFSNVTVTAPAGFQVSLSAATGFANSIVITAINGFITSTVYVRQFSNNAGNPAGNIIVTATGAIPVNFAVTGTVLPPAFITQEPTNPIVCFGNSTIITAAATGTSLAYQWQINNGIGFTNITNANTISLPIIMPPSGNNYNGSQYRLIVTGNCTPDTSNIVTLSIQATPTVVISATKSEIKPGETTILTANATPAGGTYSWYRNDGNTLLSTNATYGPIGVNQLGSYKVVYNTTNGCAATSFPFVLKGTFSNDIWVYPNPSKGKFYFRYFNRDNTIVKAVVYNSMGKKVFEQKFATGLVYSENLIDISNQAPGNYVLSVTNQFFEIIAVKQIMIGK